MLGISLPNFITHNMVNLSGINWILLLEKSLCWKPTNEMEDLLFPIFAVIIMSTIASSIKVRKNKENRNSRSILN